MYLRLGKAIESGSLKPGQLVTSTRELCDTLNVSYHGAVQGMSRLAREGWVVRRSGQGTYVRDREAQPLHPLPRDIAIVAGEGRAENYFLNSLIAALKEELQRQGHLVRIEAHSDSETAVPPEDIEADCAVWVKNLFPTELTLPSSPPSSSPRTPSTAYSSPRCPAMR